MEAVSDRHGNLAVGIVGIGKAQVEARHRRPGRQQASLGDGGEEPRERLLHRVRGAVH